MGVLVFSVWIKATPSQVWHTYVDPYRIPDWQTGNPVVEDVSGAPGEPGSAYVSRRGPLVAHTTVLSSERPARLVTRTEAYLGLELQITSRLTARAGGTDLEIAAETHWPPRRRTVGRLVERVVLSRRENDKELANLKAVVERETQH